MNRTLTITVLLAAASLLVAAQTTTAPASGEKKTTINKVAAPHTSPADGKASYIAYCAACHGADAKGNGPAAPALKVPATDLTQLTKKNGGQFPTLHVQQSIRDAENPAHGSKDMPVWGPVFRSLAQGSQSQVELRVANLTKYIESIQTK